MSDDTLFYWGMIVTTFLGLAALLTARELIEMRLEERAAASEQQDDD